MLNTEELPTVQLWRVAVIDFLPCVLPPPTGTGDTSTSSPGASVSVQNPRFQEARKAVGLDGYLQANVGRLKKCKYSSAKLNGIKGAVLRSHPTVPSAPPLSGSLVSGPTRGFSSSCDSKLALLIPNVYCKAPL